MRLRADEPEVMKNLNFHREELEKEIGMYIFWMALLLAKLNAMWADQAEDRAKDKLPPVEDDG